MKLHSSAVRLRTRRARLLKLEERVQQQIRDADCLLATIEDYCRENPEDCRCAATDPAWPKQVERQREDLVAMLLAVRERLKVLQPKPSRSVAH